MLQGQQDLQGFPHIQARLENHRLCLLLTAHHSEANQQEDSARDHPTIRHGQNQPQQEENLLSLNHPHLILLINRLLLEALAPGKIKRDHHRSEVLLKILLDLMILGMTILLTDRRDSRQAWT